MAKRAMGTTISQGATPIGYLTSISAPEISADTIDTTVLNVSDNYRTFMQGLCDGGEVSVSGFFETSDAGQLALNTALNAGTESTYTITFPTALGATWIFNGIVTNLKTGEANIDDPIGFEVTLKVTGKPNLGTTASGGLSALTLTGAGGALVPTFSAALRSYMFSGVSATSVTVTPTAASHTIKLYIDGVYSQDVTSGAASNSISLTINVSKKLTLICYEAAKTPVVYDIIVNKTA